MEEEEKEDPLAASSTTKITNPKVVKDDSNILTKSFNWLTSGAKNFFSRKAEAEIRERAASADIDRENASQAVTDRLPALAAHEMLKS
jgi:hypothetical protein